MSAKLLTFAILVSACAAQSCISCSPSGWTAATLPPLGSGLSNLYVDLVNSVAGITFKNKRHQGALEPRASSAPICCQSTTQCLLLQGLDVPFCYDKFTTNYLFPDGSYGTIATGDYTAADGTQANLISGDYTSNGQASNIYASDSAAKPNTATLSIPPQFTASGQGSAIPISDLGSIVYILSTSTGTTVVPATTVEATTIAAATVSGAPVPASTVPASTIPASTVTTEATLTVSTSTRTGSAPTATTSKKGAAASRPAPAVVAWSAAGAALLALAVYGLAGCGFD